MIDLYKSQPYGPAASSYYPPLKKFGMLLRRLRYLGIYHDEHLVRKYNIAFYIYAVIHVEAIFYYAVFRKDN